jgi:putative membrane protein
MPEETLRAVRKTFRFPILVRLWPYLAATGAYAVLVVLFGERIHSTESGRTVPDFTSEALLTGIVFGWLLSFRTVTAYARWWEGRGLWGRLINSSRNLRLKANTLVSDASDRARLGELLARFGEELRDHLRRPKNAEGPHVPMAIAGEIYSLINAWRVEGRIDGFGFLALDAEARGLMEVCGACEKIRNTPLVTSYRGLLRKGITAYILFLPWLLHLDNGWLTVPFTLLVVYAVVGLELIASNIEDPFGFEGDNLPLDRYAAAIRASVT